MLARKAPTPTPPPRIDWSSGNGQEFLRGELLRSNIPPKYVEATWARCRVERPLREYTARLERHLNAGRGLLMLGPVGTGKSSAAALVAAEVIKLERTVWWAYVPDLIAELRDHQKRQSEMTRRQISADLVIWDDFGVGGLAPWEIGWLDRIVEGRYRRNRPMLVTSNMAKRSLQDPELARLSDRWAERSFVVNISGESMRRTWRDDQEGAEDGV